MLVFSAFRPHRSCAWPQSLGNIPGRAWRSFVRQVGRFRQRAVYVEWFCCNAGISCCKCTASYAVMQWQEMYKLLSTTCCSASRDGAVAITSSTAHCSLPARKGFRRMKGFRDMEFEFLINRLLIREKLLHAGGIGESPISTKVGVISRVEASAISRESTIEKMSSEPQGRPSRLRRERKS